MKVYMGEQKEGTEYRPPSVFLNSWNGKKNMYHEGVVAIYLGDDLAETTEIANRILKTIQEYYHEKDTLADTGHISE